MTPEDAEALRILVQARSGVMVNPANTYQIETRLGPVARREGVGAVDELIGAIRTGRDERLMWAVTEAMVCTETWFFRDVEPFDRLKHEILPQLSAARDRPLRIWSASCSTGQEAWSLAMSVAEARAMRSDARVELFASDLSDACLQKAQSGLYTQFEAQRGLPIRMLLRYFEKQDEMWQVRQELSRAVRWRRINLLSDLTPLGEMDVIFCRNTLSQFDRNSRRRVLEQFRSMLAEDGYLFLGAAEAADDIEGFFQTSQSGLYRRRREQQTQAA
ncbi:MAG: protein-glutamate O-methyltransferase CheR [Alphaproteobacteria bacterium]